MKSSTGLILIGVVMVGTLGVLEHHKRISEAAEARETASQEAAAFAAKARRTGAGNDLSISPEKPASPDQWWLRSLADGSDVPFSQFKGKVVFLSFWATWCGPCLQDMPVLERMYQKLKGQGIEMVIVANQNPRDVQPYLSQNHFSFPMYTCGMPPELFMWHSLPSTFVIAPDGRVVRTFLDPYAFDGDEFIQSLIALKNT